MVYLNGLLTYTASFFFIFLSRRHFSSFHLEMFVEYNLCQLYMSNDTLDLKLLISEFW